MTFEEFYTQEYVPRHAAPACRLLHYLGPVASGSLLAVTVWLGAWWLVPLLPVPSYLLAWVGHVLAHNRPTFFEHPWWSFLGYWKMLAGG